jgi:hypothetical protein
MPLSRFSFAATGRCGVVDAELPLSLGTHDSVSPLRVVVDHKEPLLKERRRQRAYA